MPDVTLVQSSANNGVATPATPGSLTLTNHNLAVFIVLVRGTNPTIATPASWTQVQKVQGASISFAMYVFPNQAGGATNPSSTLGGTVAGWVAVMAEFGTTGVNEAVLASNLLTSSNAQLTDVFSGISNQSIPNMLWLYAVGRITATLQAQNTVLNWSASIQPQAGVQGLSLDFFWASNQQNGPWPPPQSSGLLASAVASAQIGAMLNSAASQFGPNDIVQGNAGIYVPVFYQGTMGG